MATGKRITDTERRDILAAHRNGQSASEIATLYRRSRSTVHKVLNEATTRSTTDPGTPSRGKKRTSSAVALQRATVATGAVAKGRQTAGLFANSALRYILPPEDEHSGWTSYDLDGESWRKMDLAKTMRVLGRISPDISRAIWDYLRLCDAGFELKAYNPGKDTEHTRGTAALDALMDNLERYYGGMQIQTGRIFTSILTRGQFVVELVLDRSGRRPIDLVVPDPAEFAFRREQDRDRGETWKLGQWQDGEFVILDYPNIISVSIDPEPDTPYGKPLIGPAVFPTIFLIGLMHDLRRVIAQQGYPRTDVSIDIEMLLRQYEHLEPEEFEDKVNEIAQSIASFYASLEPDDAYVHTNVATLDRASGAVDASVVSGAVDLIDTLERQAMRALKSMPLLMGDTEGAGESHSNREWEIFAKGIKSLQQRVETNLNRLFTLALEVQGIPAEARLKFAEIRETEELKDEQTLAQKIENQAALRDQGWITQDEASMNVVGKNAALPEPIAPVPEEEEVLEDDDVVADPGSDRSKRRRRRAVSRREVSDPLINRARRAWEAAHAGTDYEYLLDAEPVESEGGDGA